ncbi:MAG: cytochrome C peroxidase [Verrucomicrobiae bacterium]|nr:cytochrome C peroxidase [Verrucomicrobiae bacterium]
MESPRSTNVASLKKLRRIPVWVALFAAVFIHCLQAADLNLEITPCFEGRPMAGSTAATDSKLTISRLDWLVSGLALKRVDGSWMEGASDWHAYYGLDGKRVGTRADGVPDGDYTAIRFRVGVDKVADGSDPNIYPVGDALHPDVCGLHWSWQGGYIYLAIEGKRLRADGASDGFSYHLARVVDGMTVELPVKFSAGSPLTIEVRLHADRILQGVDFDKDGLSTHSREGDSLAPRMMENVRGAFEVIGVKADIFQDTNADPVAAPVALPKGTAPYKLDITRRFPAVKLPADNPLTEEGVALGRKLFNDPRLSINNSQSCASCHLREHAFTDPRRLSIGATGDIGKRNAMPLFNLAWASDYFWDGRAATLRDQVLVPLQDPHEMAESLENVVKKLEADDSYRDAFRRASGEAGITSTKLALALEQFLLTLVSQDAKFDRAVRKLDTFTPDESRGLELFLTEFDPARGMRGADCFHCHGGTLFTSHKYADNGLDLKPVDSGRMTVTGDETDRGKFKIPSLRNVELTAPYMHDGRFKTLEEVVEHYSSGVHRSPNLDPNLAKHPDEGIKLSSNDKRALVAFLKTLTDRSFVAPKQQ